MSDFFAQLDTELGKPVVPQQTTPPSQNNGALPSPSSHPATNPPKQFSTNTAPSKPVTQRSSFISTKPKQLNTKTPPEGKILGKVTGSFSPKNRPTKRLELPQENHLLPTHTVANNTTHAPMTSPVAASVIKGLNVPVIFPKSSEPQILPKIDKNITRIIPIGGLRTVGANMTMFEHGDDIIIVDGGLEFARGGNSPGFNYLLPDIRFLQAHTKRIKAMFVTHGHLDHIGAL